MPNDPEISSTSDKTIIIAPCHGCGVEIPTRGAIGQVDDEGNIISKIAFDLCAGCQTDLERRVEERKIDAARRRAKYEKTLADLISRVPKPTEQQMNLGLDR